MNRWPTESLGSLCDVRIGRTPRRDEPRFWGGDAVWVTIRELNGGEITSSNETISEAAVRECMPAPIPVGTLLFSFKLSIGKMAVAGRPLYTNEAIAALPIRNPARLSRDFLRYALLAESHEATANSAVLGKVLNKEKVEQLPIPVPPLSEQERIVKLLDDADRLCTFRAQADRRAADLIPALFHEMFGDLIANPNAWPVRRLDAVVAPGRIVTYGIVQAGPNLANGVPYIRTGDLKDGVIRIDRLLRTSPEIAASYRRSEVTPGEIVMSIRATVGTTAIVPQELSGANLTQGTARISPGPETITDYLLWHLRMPATQSWIQGQVKGATFREITLGNLRQLPVLIPPLPLQKKFAMRVAEIKEVEAKQTASRNYLGALFQSMLHRAFRGDL